MGKRGHRTSSILFNAVLTIFHYVLFGQAFQLATHTHKFRVINHAQTIIYHAIFTCAMVNFASSPVQIQNNSMLMTLL